MTKFSRVNLTERVLIEQFLKEGRSISWIARSIQRNKSTISREVRRGGLCPASYSYRKAQAMANRWKIRNRRKVKIQGALEQVVLWFITELQCSPQQISGRIRRQYPSIPELHVSHETIYKYIYNSPFRKRIISHLRRRPKRRGPRPKSNRGGIKNKVSISKRPDLSTREEFGHWEGDLIVGPKNHSAMGTLVERSSGYTIMVPLRGKSSLHVVNCFIEALRDLPKHLRKSFTYDQGTEMADHQRFSAELGMSVYFADPGKPYQRGSNENTNGLIRQFFPKKTDLSSPSFSQVKTVQNKLNARPRKRLAYASPQEIFDKALANKDLTRSAALGR